MIYIWIIWIPPHFANALEHKVHSKDGTEVIFIEAPIKRAIIINKKSKFIIQ